VGCRRYRVVGHGLEERKGGGKRLKEVGKDIQKKRWHGWRKEREVGQRHEERKGGGTEA
jgi:hypothetical protein